VLHNFTFCGFFCRVSYCMGLRVILMGCVQMAVHWWWYHLVEWTPMFWPFPLAFSWDAEKMAYVFDLTNVENILWWTSWTGYVPFGFFIWGSNLCIALAYHMSLFIGYVCLFVFWGYLVCFVERVQVAEWLIHGTWFHLFMSFGKCFAYLSVSSHDIEN
jgi:hypothetical protein